MKLGFVSAILADMDLRGVVETAAGEGYDCVEVEDRAYEHSLEGRIVSLRQSAAYLRTFVPHKNRCSC